MYTFYSQTCQLIVFTPDKSNIIITQLQAGQLVVITGKIAQFCIIAYIKACQLIITTDKLLQIKILTHIQARQLIVATVEIFQLSILAQIHTRKLIPWTIQKYGNTSSVSVPLTIASELKNKMAGEKRLLLSAFGVGMAWATAIVPFVDCKISDIVEI